MSQAKKDMLLAFGVILAMVSLCMLRGGEPLAGSSARTPFPREVAR